VSEQHPQHAPIGFFDGRADSDFFLIDVDGTAVLVKVDRPTHGVTDGGVRYACRIADRLFEGRAKDVAAARRLIPLNVRAWRATMGLRADVPTIGAWTRLGHLEEAVPCESCGARPGEPCRDETGAPGHAHVARIVAHDLALRGRGKI